MRVKICSETGLRSPNNQIECAQCLRHCESFELHEGWRCLYPKRLPHHTQDSCHGFSSFSEMVLKRLIDQNTNICRLITLYLTVSSTTQSTVATTQPKFVKIPFKSHIPNKYMVTASINRRKDHEQLRHEKIQEFTFLVSSDKTAALWWCVQ